MVLFFFVLFLHVNIRMYMKNTFNISTYHGMALGKREYSGGHSDVGLTKKVAFQDSLSWLDIIEQSHRSRISHIVYGKCPGNENLKPVRNEKNFLSCDFFGLDFDGTITKEQLKQKLCNLKWQGDISFTKSHGKKKGDRLRLLIPSDKTIYKASEYKVIINFLFKTFPECDKNCGDLARFFYASKSSFYTNTTGKQLPVSVILDEEGYDDSVEYREDFTVAEFWRINKLNKKHRAMVKRLEKLAKAANTQAIVAESTSTTSDTPTLSLSYDKVPQIENVAQVKEEIKHYLKFVAKPGIAGKSGDKTTFSAIIHIMMRFKKFTTSLDDYDILLPMVMEYYNPRCIPQWTEREIKNKIKWGKKYSAKWVNDGVTVAKKKRKSRAKPKDQLLSREEKARRIQEGRNKKKNSSQKIEVVEVVKPKPVKKNFFIFTEETKTECSMLKSQIKDTMLKKKVNYLIT